MKFKILLTILLILFTSRFAFSKDQILTDLEKKINTYYSEGNLEKAIAACIEARDYAAGKYGVESTTVAFIDNNMANMYKKMGKLDEAEKYYKESLLILEKKYGDKFPTSASIMSNLANLYTEQKKFDEAETLYDKSLKILKETVGENDINTSTTKNNLAELYLAKQEFGRAIPLFETALEAFEKEFGGKDMSTAMVLSNLATCYLQTQNYDKAEKLLLKAIPLFTALQGQDNDNLITIYNNLGEIAVIKGEPVKAETYMRQAVEIWKRKPGESSLMKGYSMLRLGDILVVLNRYSEAVPCFREAVVIFEKIGSPNNPEIPKAYNALGNAYMKSGKYSEAFEILTKALSISEKQPGDNQDVTAHIINNFANLYRNMGEWDKAETFFKKAIKIRSALNEKGSLQLAVSMNDLAMMYKDRGRYTEASDLLEKSVKMYGSLTGENNPYYASILSNLAVLSYEQGNYARAEELFKKALEIKKKTLPEGHPSIGITMGQIADLQYRQGRLPDAIITMEEALRITENAYGPYHINTGAILNNLANLYAQNRNLKGAEQLLLRSLEINEKTYGNENYSLAAILNNLGHIELVQRHFDKASKYFERSLEITKKSLGENHPNVAILIDNMGEMAREKGDYQKAYELFQKALDINIKILGENHPNISQSLNRVAMAQAAMDRYEDAYRNSIKAIKIEDRTIENVFSLASEKEKLAFLDSTYINTACLMSLIINNLSNDPEKLMEGMNLMLRRKGLVLDALSKERNFLLQSEDSQTRETYKKLRELSSMIASMTLSGPDTQTPDEYRRKLDTLQKEWEKTDKELIKLSSLYASKKKKQNIECEEVAKGLPSHSVLIDYFMMGSFSFKESSLNKIIGGYSYYAFILPSSKDSPEGISNPILVRLGEAAVIDRAIMEYRKEIVRAKKMWENGILDEAEYERRLSEKGKAVYELVVAPVLEKTGKAKTLFISPDGNLNLIPIGCLQDNSGKYLIEEYKITYLSSGREPANVDNLKSKTDENIIIADPDYEAPDSLKESTGKVPLIKVNKTTNREKNSDEDLHSWYSLPETGNEAESIKELLKDEKVTIYLGKSCSEETVKNIKSPRRLHIATHGFFLEDREVDLFPNGRYEIPGEDNKIKIAYQNPLLRSGLVLAGANRQTENSLQDGILTALEISGMDLNGTDLVVLSACETGIGATRIGEGVYGLRRAFQLAGTKTVIMSLWSVPDKETGELMIDYYRSLMEGSSKSDALRNASIKMIHKRRSEKGAAHPFFWGAFISAGEP